MSCRVGTPNFGVESSGNERVPRKRMCEPSGDQEGVAAAIVTMRVGSMPSGPATQRPSPVTYAIREPSGDHARPTPAASCTGRLPEAETANVDPFTSHVTRVPSGDQPGADFIPPSEVSACWPDPSGRISHTSTALWTLFRYAIASPAGDHAGA